MADVFVMIQQAQKGDKAARDRLVEDNLGLVWNIVKRFYGRGYEADDLFQIGCIGLIKAIDHFDAQYSVCFSTYAVPVITGEIKRFLRDDGLIKVSRSLKENNWRIHKASRQLNQQLGREATIDELAAATELAPEEIVMAMEAGREVESIDRPLYRNEGRTVSLADQVMKGPGGSLGFVSVCTSQNAQSGEVDSGKDLEKEQVIDQLLLEQLIGGLTSREQAVIRKRYFEEKTQTEIARELGISQVQVSRLEKKCLKTMRSMLE